MTLQLILQLICLVWLIDPLIAADDPSWVKPNCTKLCGNVIIPYPFGIGKGCYYDEWYAVACNDSFSPGKEKPFLSKFNLEMLNVTLQDDRLVKLNIPIASNCPKQDGGVSSFKGSPFNFSSRINEFTVVGCDNALLTDKGEIVAGCTSSCSRNISTTNACYGINCCQTTIPNDLDGYGINITGGNCTSAFLVDQEWFRGKISNPYVVNNTKHVPVAMTRNLTDLGDVKEGTFTDYKCERHGPYYSCQCGWAHEGNPYIIGGCKVVQACADCVKECSKLQDGIFYCNKANKREKIISSSLGGGIWFLNQCCFCFCLYKFIMKKRTIRLGKKFFKRNGGLLLQQQLSSHEDIVDKTKMFSSKELEKATDNFNENRILGQGGQGTVYKGMLSDGKIVAIKKSKMIDVSQIEQFINEVFILSQINHRNVVKLLGCCLETEVPLLVYEFVSNGNLFELIRDQNEEFPLTWKMRLQIATEVAGALAYLHSASSIPIYHRDIKSTNILLDEKYRAKVSDFGTSRTIAIEQTHLTTIVHGTFGYLDPEYFRSSQFTEKSDVYSFGVVLVELLTGQKAISSISSEEEKSLATRFISFMKQNRLFDILDQRVIEEAQKEQVIAVADIAKRCLSLNGKKRPTMTEVVMELEGIRMCRIPFVVPQESQEDEYFIDNASTSSHTGFTCQTGFSEYVDPLLMNTI